MVRLLFDATMDTSVIPAVGSFALIVEAVPRAVESISYDDPTTLRLVSETAIPAVDPVTLELLVEDPLLHALGGRPVLPFGPETLPVL